MSAFSWLTGRPLSVAQSEVTFPNRSRSLDAAGAWISFWGYASTVEVTFQIDTGLLQRMSGVPLPNEASLLQAFDANRQSIEKAASATYAKRRVSFCRLDATDFSARSLRACA